MLCIGPCLDYRNYTWTWSVVIVKNPLGFALWLFGFVILWCFLVLPRGKQQECHTCQEQWRVTPCWWLHAAFWGAYPFWSWSETGAVGLFFREPVQWCSNKAINLINAPNFFIPKKNLKLGALLLSSVQLDSDLDLQGHACNPPAHTGKVPSDISFTELVINVVNLAHV